MEIKAETKYIRISPRKIRLVAGLIKGMDVIRAKVELAHLLKRAAEPLEKILRSAVANARHNFSLEESKLIIRDVRVNPGPVLKRTRARAFGRAAMIRKRMSHISILLVLKDAATNLKFKNQNAK